jgi:hypothetical protein
MIKHGSDLPDLPNDPTPAEIAARAAEIRAGWSEGEEWIRRHGVPRSKLVGMHIPARGWKVPVIPESQLGLE